jgi:hypothetical protein
MEKDALFVSKFKIVLSVSPLGFKVLQYIPTKVCSLRLYSSLNIPTKLIMHFGQRAEYN